MNRSPTKISPPASRWPTHQAGSPFSGIFLLWVAALLLIPRTTKAQMLQASEVSLWTPATLFPFGAMLNIVSGDPSLPGPTTVELLLPDGYRVPPHFHPMGERLRVREGTLLVGSGDYIDVKSATLLNRGDTAYAAADLHHYWVAHGRTVITLTFDGPFVITYIHAYQAPRIQAFPYRQ